MIFYQAMTEDPTFSGKVVTTVEEAVEELRSMGYKVENLESRAARGPFYDIKEHVGVAYIHI